MPKPPNPLPSVAAGALVGAPKAVGALPNADVDILLPKAGAAVPLVAPNAEPNIPPAVHRIDKYNRKGSMLEMFCC